MAACTQYVLSICSGVGSLDLGLRIAVPDIVTACYVEREISAVEVLVARMEEGSLHQAPVYSDLLTFDGRPWRGLISVVGAGLPCQPYSVAGKQLGHDDERAIWPAFVRVVGEVQPDVVFLENVPAFLGYFRPVGNELQRMGYVVEEPVLVTASECGASHRRERFFALAHRAGRGLRELRESSRRSGFTDRSYAQLGYSASHQQRGNPDGAYRERLSAGGSSGNLEITQYQGSPRSGPEAGSPTKAGDSLRPSWSLADSARDERDGSHGEAGPQWGVCETSDRVGSGSLADRDRARCDGSAREELRVCGRPLQAARSGNDGGSVADAGDRLIPEQGKRPERRDGAGPASQVLADTKRCGTQRQYESGRAGSGRTEPSRNLPTVANADSVGAERESGILRGPQGAGESEGPERQRDGSTTRYGGIDMADTECAKWRPDVECDSESRGRIETPDRPGGAGIPMGNPDHEGLEGWLVAGQQTGQGRQRVGVAAGSELPLFAPGPGARELWQRILRDRPELAPAISKEEAESYFHGVDDAMARLVVHERTDALRASGNGCVPLQVALAFSILIGRACGAVTRDSSN